jgi:hypothetical protein
VTKISQLSSIGDSLAIGDQFLIRDIDDAGSPNKSVTVSGITRALADGDATAPALAFAADKNTGIYRAGTDFLAVATNGTGRLFVDANGNVGLGTSSPANFAGFVTLALADSSGAEVDFIKGSTIQGSLYNASDIFYVESKSTVPTAFVTNGSERARIDSSGRLLVGTSSSLLSYANLQVTGGSDSAGHVCLANTSAAPVDGANIGSIRFTNSAGGIGAIFGCEADGAWTPGSNYRSRLVFSTTADGASSPTERLLITAAGLVGIGVSAPSYQLDLGGGTTVNTRIQIARGSDDSNAMRIGYNTIDLYRNVSLSSAQTGLAINQVGSDGTRNVFQIDSSGRCGIGTASPAEKLHISAASPYIRVEATGGVTGSAYYGFNNATGGADIVSTSHIRFAVPGLEAARIDSSGRLLVGTSSARTYTTGGAGGNHKLQLETAGATSVFTTAGIYSNSDVAGIGAYLELGRSKGTALGAVTAVALNDILGEIRFAGTNGTAANSAASIAGYVDGAVSGGGANDMPGRIVLATTADGAASPTERLRITSTGQVRLAGAGITFNGDTAVANELDDYEEGTWTPSLGGTATYTVQDGNYTKVGRLVNIRCNITVNLIGTGSTFQISGLPFTPATTATGNPNAFGVVGYFESLAVSPVYISTFAASGGTTINVTGLTAAGATASPVLGVFGNSARIDFTMTYYVG